jgi:ABC-type multidrug transport system ATPase subunit
VNGLEISHGAISFTVAGGDFFALLGTDDAVKRSLVTAMTTQPPEARQSVGFMFRSPALYPYLTVLENLRCHGGIYGMSSHNVARGAERALERLGLMPLAHTRVSALPVPVRRRVELAKVLVPEPALIVLDEPGTGSSPRERREFLRDLQRLRDDAGTTIVFTTDVADEAAQASRVGVLDGEKLSAIGHTSDVMDAIRRFAAS